MSAQPALAFDYIDDVPWERHPAFAASDLPAYAEGFAKVLDRVPEGGGRISFSSDRWDFVPYFEKHSGPSYVLRFEGLPFEIKDACKFFAIYSMRMKKSVPTVNSRLGSFKSLAVNVLAETAHGSISLVTTEEIVEEIEGRGAGHVRCHALYQSACQVLRFLERHFGFELLADVDELEERGIRHNRASKDQADARKLPDIPAEYFDAILGAATEAMRDESAPFDERATACALVMLTQLGLRSGDLLGLGTGRLRSTTLPKSGRKASFIRYESRKPSKPHDRLLEFDMFSTALCTEAYETLAQVRERHPLAGEVDFLYLNSSVTDAESLPVENRFFNDQYLALLARRVPELSAREWPGVPARKVKVDGAERVVSAPVSGQYRVHLCTALYNHGVPLTYIQKFMGHLSDSMVGYYARPKDTFQEDAAYSEKVIREMVSYDLTPLGGSQGPEIKQRLREFAEEGRFNVDSDIAAIVEALGSKVAIRAKRGGACIRASLMPCAQDARTDEVLCAYGLCPNIFHFFYTADITYADFLTLQQTYAANMAAGFGRAADKELAKMRDLCRRRLLPELDELDREIERKGEDWIESRYPALRGIIDRRDAIREEVSEWMRIG